MSRATNASTRRGGFRRRFGAARGVLARWGALALPWALVGCGGGGGGGGPQPPVGVTVSPTAVTLAVGAATTFRATVTNSADTAVTWSVQEGAAGGSVGPLGGYTAPATAGTYHVVATSVADPTKSAVATVTVPIAVRIDPASHTMSVGDSQTFVATVVGTTDTRIAWSVREGAVGGSVSASGGYVAPAAAGTYHVVATSEADPTKSAVATVTVQSGGASGTIR